MTALLKSVMPGTMTIESRDIKHGEFMSKRHEADVFGGDGDNVSPHLSWSGAPEGTKAYAVFCFDPDAPTCSGFWHWQLINIPASVTELATGAGSSDSANIPEGSFQKTNDYGTVGFGGACPPEGHIAHRYQFTVFALSDKLDIPEGASSAVAGFMVNAHALASVTLEALYKR
ncbi:YbhB/YbcL family Raf kinase inhibitor-like protein [Alteromonas facilis]|uniref:YbhB/YbcL family Raf kinase inhibitor-like protein n=1 Tax=Alteromonas facilis TaxID=2048004 RepID=UPI000C293C7B|nr:YbhB/YbcL family Raf kinase inhibitor-like protein [Alteromonas facilis]